MKKWQANIGLLVVAIIWGGSFVATDYLVDYLSPMNVQIYRNVIATIILVIIFFKKLVTAKKKTVLIGLLLGSLFLGANAIQSQGLLYTTVSKNAFLTANYVIFIPLISIFIFRKFPTKYTMIGIFIMLIGYFFILFNINVFDINSYLNLKEQLSFNYGDFLTIICALGFAFHILAVSYFMKNEDPFQVLLFQSLFASIIGIVVSLVTKQSFQFEMIYEVGNFILPLLYMAIFSSILCFGGQLVFQKYTDSQSAGILMSLEAAFASMFAVMLGVDDFYTGLLVGGAVLIVGIIIAETELKFLFKQEQN